MRSKHSSGGFTLIELMIGVALGVLVLLALGTMLSDQIRTSQSARRAIILNQDLREAMDLMQSDLRRTGYFVGSASSPASVSPLYALPSFSGKAMQTGTIGSGSDVNCILYAFDRDNDIVSPTTAVPDKYRFGFALLNGVLYAHRTGNAAYSCTAAAVGNAAEWEPITQASRLTITRLHFAKTATANPSTSGATPIMCSWQVTISLTAQTPKDAAIQKNMTETVQLRNGQRKEGTNPSCI